MNLSPYEFATKLIPSVAPLVNMISSRCLALINLFTKSLVSSNLLVAVTAKECTLLPTLENSFS